MKAIVKEGLALECVNLFMPKEKLTEWYKLIEGYSKELVGKTVEVIKKGEYISIIDNGDPWAIENKHLDFIEETEIKKLLPKWIDEFTLSIRNEIIDAANQKFEEIKNKHGLKNSELFIDNKKPLRLIWDLDELILIYNKSI